MILRNHGGERARRQLSQAGSVLLFAVVLTAALGVLSVSLLGWATGGGKRSVVDVRRAQAFYLAESGLAEALARLNGSTMLPPGNGGRVEFPSGEALGWDGGSYRVAVTRVAGGGLEVEATGAVGETSRRVTARLGQASLVPAEVFGPGREGVGVRTTAPGDRYYDPGLVLPPRDPYLPPLPEQVMTWDSRTSLDPGTYAFDRVEVDSELRIQGPVTIYVRGDFRVSDRARVTCSGPGGVRVLVYRRGLQSDQPALYLGSRAEFSAQGPAVWKVAGDMVMAGRASFSQDSPGARCSLNVMGDLSVGSRAMLGTAPSPGEPPRLAVVLGPAETAPSFRVDPRAAVNAMIYAPDAQVFLQRRASLDGALVGGTVEADRGTFKWNPAIAGLADGSGWELLAGWWEVERGTWASQ